MVAPSPKAAHGTAQLAAAISGVAWHEAAPMLHAWPGTEVDATASAACAGCFRLSRQALSAHAGAACLVLSLAWVLYQLFTIQGC